MIKGLNENEKYRQEVNRFTSILFSESDRTVAIEKIAAFFVPDYADACVVHFEKNQFPKIAIAFDEQTTPSGASAYKSEIEFPLGTLERKLGVIRFYSLKADAFVDNALTSLLADLSRWVVLAMERHCDQSRTNEAVQDCNDFIALLLHEIRNPLTCLQINNQIMKTFFDAENPRPFTAEKMASLLKSSETTISKISKIAENMQNTVSVQRGEIHLERKEFPLSELIEAVIQMHRPAAEKAGCNIEWSTRALPSVNWDRIRTEQMLNNILENAIKYGAGKPIQIAATTQDQRVKVSVSDQGIGIEPEHLKKIFDCYERGSCKGSSPGLGLGLYIAQQIAKAHGGNIDVKSQLGAGSTFFLDLPLTP